MNNSFPEFESRMVLAGMSRAAIESFKHAYLRLLAGDTGLVPEREIQPVLELPRLIDLPTRSDSNKDLLAQTVVLKLNGGLGTSMGLDRAKSLLVLKDGLTFLDFIARQILHLRKAYGSGLRFMLMNSFSTSADTLQYLSRYPELGDHASLELMQNQVPKVDAATGSPATWPQNSALEWCPPGHGDIYPALLGSGWLDRLLDAGVKYAFVSNSDNLGASLDPALLHHFASSDAPFLMEVAERTSSDRKGGHLARRDGRFLLRESAQCPESDSAAFQDIALHRFFNTNNLWLRLDRIRDLVVQNNGFLPLPLIRNAKTIDPRDRNSTAVIQLESAMGAAIECFEDSQAVVVPRSRFAPVKTTSDLLALRSDAYRVTDDWRVVLGCESGDQPPAIDLDPTHYRAVNQFEALMITGEAPSLRACTSLRIRGPVILGKGNRFRGNVTIQLNSTKPTPLPDGTYADSTTELP